MNELSGSLNVKTSDPVFYHNGGQIYNDSPNTLEEKGWFFWCEDWATYYGPYPTEQICREALVEYAKQL